MGDVLYCHDHGWHPCLREIIDRLLALEGATRPSQGPYLKVQGILERCFGLPDALTERFRRQLIREAGACDAPGHLTGCLARAACVLRREEETELRGMTEPEEPEP